MIRYQALATDYDGTIATQGAVPDPVVEAMLRLKASGRRLLLVTGRELPDLFRVCPRWDVFDRIVAENGALLFRPETREEKCLDEPPPPEFVEALRGKGVENISVGRVIVATWEPHETAVMQVIRDMGLELQVIFNKGAVMVLPSGVNKATGLTAALLELGLSPHNCVAVGDAENDHAFLNLSEFGVAVYNALPSLKERADWVTEGDHGDGVVELIERVLADDLASMPAHPRHRISMGGGVTLPEHGAQVLIVGASGVGKSTFLTAVLEQLTAGGYQWALVDPEGDHDNLEQTIVLGSPDREPDLQELLSVMESPRRNVALNLVGVELHQRTAWFPRLALKLGEVASHAGRPHWLVLDEAHHVLSGDAGEPALKLEDAGGSRILVTIYPRRLPQATLEGVNVVVGIGEASIPLMKDFFEATGRAVPAPARPRPGECLIWTAEDPDEVRLFRPIEPQTERRRHVRKYAEGELPEDRSFFFRGPAETLNLRARNLVEFLRLAEGLDDETWLYHLRRGDYARWFRQVIKDEGLAVEAEAVQEQPATESRERIAAAIQERYTVPVQGFDGPWTGLTPAGSARGWRSR